MAQGCFSMITNRKLSLCLPVFFAPNAELIQYLHQRFSTLGERILHLRRDLRILGADDQFVCFQLLEIRAESLVGNGFQIPFQFIESHRLKLHQAVKNDRYSPLRKKLYVQVCYLLASDETVNREFGAYDAIRDNFPKYVVSLDELDMSRNGIKHRNIRDFLLAGEWN